MNWRAIRSTETLEWSSAPGIGACNFGDSNLLSLFVHEIGVARESIVICSFLISSAEIIEALRGASERGVRVYVMTAPEGLKLHERFEEPSEKWRAEKMRSVLHALAQFALVRSARPWHAKFLLVDARSHENGRGWLSSANMNNGSLTTSPEYAVPLRPPEVDCLFRIARREFWTAEFQARSDGSFFPIPHKEAADWPPVDCNIVTSSTEPSLIDQHIVAAIESAQNSILVSTYLVQAKSEVLSSLLRASSRGLEVNLLTHISPNNAVVLSPLREAGARIVGLEWLHAKFVACDADVLLFHSQNMANPTTERSFDILLPLEGDRAHLGRTWLEQAFSIATHALAN